MKVTISWTLALRLFVARKTGINSPPVKSPNPSQFVPLTSGTPSSVFVCGEHLLSGVEIVQSILLISYKTLTKRKEELGYLFLYQRSVGNTVLCPAMFCLTSSLSLLASPYPRCCWKLFWQTVTLLEMLCIMFKVEKTCLQCSLFFGAPHIQSYPNSNKVV